MTPTGLILRDASVRLRAAGVEDAMRDARRLLAHLLGIAAERLVVDMPAGLSAAQEAEFAALVARRAAREPLSHITGSRLFYGRAFQVSADVLDPRPETETLIEQALQAPFRDVLDLGLGSGCVLLTLLAERGEATGVGADLSPAALQVAAGNAADLGVAARASFVLSDWFDAIEGAFDLIVSNPPYISEAEMAELSPEVLHEPRMALTPGGDGLSPYRVIAAGAGRHLRNGGRLLVEIGWQQGPAVQQIFRDAGLAQVQVHSDLGGKDRVVSALRSGASPG
ncbi:peptide chain release factor N(5)-glutamine methyltransferase [Pseudooceanicola spongiae]|uniref:Release factor glutamine methyltransferase n=2 Tax=Pseudooceanicola spongiae TaxID=2613965 RepID=A0A7L9WJ20_9RHOB|nr:peptide chain release factor N(5)-glutamine methyltransferase [Pseudooceanicola spongiae]